MNDMHAATNGEEVSRRTPVVVLVDDEPNLLHSLARSLRHQSYHVCTARSAEEAMDILKAHQVDLIVSDEYMSGIRGTKLLSWVAANYPTVTRIVLTGQPSVDSAVSAINAGGVFRYFVKPCDVVELALAISVGLQGTHECDRV